MRLVIPREIYIAKPIRDPKVIEEFNATHSRCQFCGDTWALQTHHIARGRKGRSDELANLLRCCLLCHTRIHCATGSIVVWNGKRYPAIPLRQQLEIKKSRDPGEWDFERLCQLFGRHLSELENE